MVNKNNVLIVGIMVLLVLGGIIVFFSGFPLTVFKVNTKPMVQYGGEFLPEETNDFDNRIRGLTAEFGEYRIVINKDSFRSEPIYTGGEPIYECSGNSCGGVTDFVDADGCQRWFKEGSTFVEQCSGVQGGNCACTEGGDCGRDPRCAAFGNTGWTVIDHDLNGCPVTQKTVTIADTNCGGLRITNLEGNCCDTRQCWAKFDIYKDNVLEESTEWTRCQGSACQQPILKELGLGNVKLFSGSRFELGECQRIENTFTFDIEDVEAHFENFRNNKVDFVVTNPNRPFVGVITIKHSGTETLEREVSLNSGVNTYEFLVPSGVFLEPSIDILIAGSEFSGINGNCYRPRQFNQAGLDRCELVLVAEFEGDEYFTVEQKECTTDNDCFGIAQAGFKAQCNDENKCEVVEVGTGNILPWIIGGVVIVVLGIFGFIFRKRLFGG